LAALRKAVMAYAKVVLTVVSERKRQFLLIVAKLGNGISLSAKHFSKYV